MPLGSTGRFEAAEEVWNDVTAFIAPDGTVDIHLKQVERDRNDPYRGRVVFDDATGRPKELNFTIGTSEAMLDLAASLLEAVMKRKEDVRRRRYHARRRAAQRSALDDPDDESRTDPTPW